MKKNIIIYSLLIAGIFGIGLFSYNNFTNNTPVYTETKYIADFNDDKKVSGFAENIFVGKVIKNNSTDKIGKEKFTDTNFEVEVLYNIKGKLIENINALQEVGYDEKGNLVMGKDDRLMQEGEVYLFATKGANPYVIISHSNGKHLLSFNNDLSKIDIKKLIKDNQIIKDFREAYKNEVYYEGSIKISSEKNAYKTLSEKEKKDFESIENGFAK